jgi:hypothetical protein
VEAIIEEEEEEDEAGGGSNKSEQAASAARLREAELEARALAAEAEMQRMREVTKWACLHGSFWYVYIRLTLQCIYSVCVCVFFLNLGVLLRQRRSERPKKKLSEKSKKKLV